MTAAPPAAPAAEDATSYGFFYGTLMAPEVFFTVCYRTKKPQDALVRKHVFLPAVLSGFSRHRVREADYPGIVADSGGSVRGILVSGLTATNIQRLDTFEGGDYDRQTVQVHVDGQDAPATAQVYVFKDASELELREWDFDEFRREKMHTWTRADYTFACE